MKAPTQSQTNKKEYITLSSLKGLSNTIDKFVSNFENVLSRFTSIKKENITDETPIYFIHTDMIDELLERQKKLEEENAYLRDRIFTLEKIQDLVYHHKNSSDDLDNMRKEYENWTANTKQFILKCRPDDLREPPIISYKQGEVTTINSGTVTTLPNIDIVNGNGQEFEIKLTGAKPFREDELFNSTKLLAFLGKQ